MLRVAVLDDSQSVAADFADWSRLPEEAEVVSLTDHLDDEDAVVERLTGFDVVVAMRERTPFPRSLLERLPGLRLLVTIGAATPPSTSPRPPTSGFPSAAPARPSACWASAGSAPGWRGSARPSGWTSSPGARTSPRSAPPRPASAAWSATSCSPPPTSSPSTWCSPGAPAGWSAATSSPACSAARSWSTPRGPIVDEAALVEALYEGRIAGAALDVYDREPLPADSSLRSAPRTVHTPHRAHPAPCSPRTVLTPHLGYVTRDTYAVFYRDAVEDVAAFLRGEPVRVIAPA